MTSDSEKSVFKHINGGLMQSYVGQDVSLMAKHQSVEAGGKLLKVMTTDNLVIVAVPKSPLTGPVEAGSYVMIEGKVENKNKVSNAVLRFLPPAICENFDEKLWNDMIAVMVEYPELVYEADLEENFGTDDPDADGSNVDVIPFPDQNEFENGAADGKAAGADTSFGDDVFDDM